MFRFMYLFGFKAIKVPFKGTPSTINYTTNAVKQNPKSTEIACSAGKGPARHCSLPPWENCPVTSSCCITHSIFSYPSDAIFPPWDLRSNIERDPLFSLSLARHVVWWPEGNPQFALAWGRAAYGQAPTLLCSCCQGPQHCCSSEAKGSWP